MTDSSSPQTTAAHHTDERETHHRIKKNAFWLFSGQIIGRALRAFFVIYSATVLGKDSWGAFSYALSLATLLTVFSDTGINALLTREAAKNPEKRSEYLSTSFYIKMGLLAILGIGATLFSHLLTNIEAVANLIPLVVLVVIFDSLRDLSSAIARSLEKMRIEGVNNILTNIVITGAGLYALYHYPTGENLMIAYVLGTAVGLTFILWSLRKHLFGLFTHFRPRLVKDIVSSSWPFGLLGLMGTIMINTDVILVGWLRSAGDVGVYSIGQKIVQLLYLIPTILATAFFPSLAKSTHDETKFRPLFEQALSLIFMIAFPLTIGGIILSEQILGFLGAEYASGLLSFIILLATIVIVFPAVLIGNAIFAHNRQKGFLLYVFLGIFGNILFDLLFIPIWGIAGASLATLLNQIIINAYAWWKMKATNHFTILDKLPNILFASAVMGILSFILARNGANIWINLALSGSGYFGILFLLKERSLYTFLGLNR